MEKSQGSREMKSEERSEPAASIERKILPGHLMIALLLGLGAGGGVMYYFCPELRNIRERRAIDKGWATVESSWERQPKPMNIHYERLRLPQYRWNDQGLLEKEAILLLKDADRMRKDQESLDRQKELWALNDFNHRQRVGDYAAWKVEYMESLEEWGTNWKDLGGQTRNSSAPVQHVDRVPMTNEERRFFNSFPQVIGSNSTHATNQVLPQKKSSDSKSTEKEAAPSSRILATKADESPKKSSDTDIAAQQPHEETKREKLEGLRQKPEASKSESNMGPGAVQALSIGVGVAIGIATAIGVLAMGGQ